MRISPIYWSNAKCISSCFCVVCRKLGLDVGEVGIQQKRPIYSLKWCIYDHHSECLPGFAATGRWGWCWLQMLSKILQRTFQGGRTHNEAASAFRIATSCCALLSAGERESAQKCKHSTEMGERSSSASVMTLYRLLFDATKKQCSKCCLSFVQNSLGVMLSLHRAQHETK